MRIKEIEIKNFKALYGIHSIVLTNTCKNLIVYGENGSGKSSFYQALKSFFDAASKAVNITANENIFIKKEEKGQGYIKVVFRDKDKDLPPFALNRNTEKITEQFIAEANKIKGFLTYKSLLQTHFLDTEQVNLFSLLITNMLSDLINPITTKEIGVEFGELCSRLEATDRRYKAYKEIPKRVEKFNNGLQQLITEIEGKANEIIEAFDYNLKIHLRFSGLKINKRNITNQQILLNVDFFDKESLPNHHHFLNEARLTAIAMSIYLASILVMPQQTAFKILVLDDILIGLDMSNRMPLLDILKKHFNEYQIFITTHDKKWYEAVKLTLEHSKWQFVEMYTKKEHQNGFEIPVVKCGDQTDFIPTAEHYLNEGDFKAAAVYIRTAFEEILVKYCNKKHLPVRFSINPSKITSEDLWQAVTRGDGIEQELSEKVISCRALVMNPFTHYDLQSPQFRSELENAIKVTKELKEELSARTI